MNCWRCRLWVNLFSTQLLLSHIGRYYYCFMTDLFVWIHKGLDYCDGV